MPPNSVEPSAIGPCLLAWAGAFLGLSALGLLIFLLTDGKDFSSPAIILIGFTPSLAALAIASLWFGVRGIRSLLRPIGKWKVGWQWYALVLLGPLVLMFLAHIISSPLGIAQPQPWVVIPALGSTLGPLIAGSLGEEIGWRGFAQPLLQKRYSMFWASIIIGILWSTWHLWPILAPNGPVHITPPDVVQTYVRLISTAVIYGWIYNKTGGSLLLVMLAHAGHNIADDILPPAAEGTALIMAFLYLVAAIAVVLTIRAQIFSRPKENGPRTEASKVQQRSVTEPTP
ncbi:CPBP family intramembrane glutamic endopeptidase [Ktedonosporobacter rubrisoli]|nr:type II CAAX endopeptidase family protein [Ktedonosporobacter rubrisoli]